MKINCFTCKYRYEDERLGIPMCHHPRRFSEDCVNFSMYEEKETEESEKPMEQEKKVEPCHRTRKILAEWSNTPEGKESYEKVAEEMRKQIVPKDLEEAATITLDEAESVADEYTDFLAKGLIENQPRPIGGKWFVEYARKRFIAGAKWDMERMKETYCPRAEKWKEVEETARHEYENGWKDSKEQMLKEAVEGEITKDNRGNNVVRAGVFNKDFEYGDKVRIIVVKEDSHE